MITDFENYNTNLILEKYENDEISYSNFEFIFENILFENFNVFIKNIISNLKNFIQHNKLNTIISKLNNIISTIFKKLKKNISSLSRTILLIILIGIFQPLYSSNQNKSDIINYQISLMNVYADNPIKIISDLKEIKDSNTLEEIKIYNDNLIDSIINDSYNKIKNLKIVDSSDKNKLIIYFVQLDQDVLKILIGKINKKEKSEKLKKSITFLKDIYNSKVTTLNYSISLETLLLIKNILKDLQNNLLKEKNYPNIFKIYLSTYLDSGEKILKN